LAQIRTGLVAQPIAEHAVRGVSVAPPAALGTAAWRRLGAPRTTMFV